MDTATRNIRCIVDWSGVSERPSGMTLMFYPVDGGPPFSYVTNCVDSAGIALPEGAYNLFLFNQTVPEYTSLIFSGLNDWNSVEVSVAPKNAPTWAVGRKFSVEPSELFVATSENIVVSGFGVKTVSLKPRTAMYNMSISVVLQKLQYAASVVGILEGVAESYYPTRHQTGPESTSISLENWDFVYENDSVGSVSTNAIIFGAPSTSRLSLLMNLILKVGLVDGKTIFEKNYGLGPTLNVSHEKMKITVTTEEAYLPVVTPASSSSGGFDVGMGDWSLPNNVGVDF